MSQNGQPQPSENDLNPWRITPGEVALGTGIFVLVQFTFGRICPVNHNFKTAGLLRETHHRREPYGNRPLRRHSHLRQHANQETAGRRWEE